MAAANSSHIRFTDSDTTSKSKPDAKKSGGNPHARYYATIFFNQIVLTLKDKDVALQLIHVYFEMFKELLGKKGEDIDDGGSRGEDGEGQKGNIDKEGRVRMRGGARGKGNRKGKETTTQGAAGFTEVEDAHSRLISAILTGVNRALPFAKVEAGDAGCVRLNHSAINSDRSRSLNAHIDTLFLITHTSTFNISLQALVLVQQVTVLLSSSSDASSMSKSITDRYYRTLYGSLHDPRLATSSKQAMYLNLLFKSIKADPDRSGERVQAFVRRFVQILVNGAGATEFVAGGLFLLGEVC
jgi:ribosome biogenesis protein MAK21